MKKDTFSAVTQVKKMSREYIGFVPSTTRIPHKNKRAPRHKMTMAKLMEEK
jgi:hypothetical protein